MRNLMLGCLIGLLVAWAVSAPVSFGSHLSPRTEPLELQLDLLLMDRLLVPRHQPLPPMPSLRPLPPVYNWQSPCP